MVVKLFASLLAAVLCRCSLAFMPINSILQGIPRAFPHRLNMSDGPSSYRDQLRAARASKGLEKQAAQQSAQQPAQQSAQGNNMPTTAPSPFSDSLQEHLRVAIETLNIRANQDKPLTKDQLNRFEHAVAAITQDAVSNVIPQAPPAVPRTPPPQTVTVESTSTPVVAPAAPKAKPAWSPKDDETEDESEFDGSYGVAPGTANTYHLDGMAAMTPEEYRQALRDKVINRAQAKRKSGNYGNLAALSYMASISGKGKAEVELEDEDFRNYNPDASDETLAERGAKWREAGKD
ncbi:unnamed protein product [Chrysoparadoxa australica]